ncbi:MAG: 2-dehydropantoate 2-reductase [Candidatus Omnitrophota bacterium]
MKIAVVGAGAIGCVIAAKLKQCGNDVFLVGKEKHLRAIKENGLSVNGVCGKIEQKIDISLNIDVRPDLIILAVKTQNIREVIERNKAAFNDALVLTVQNGVMADKIAAKYIAKKNIISSIVMFGATSINEHSVMLNFDGALVIGKPDLGDDGEVVEDDMLTKVSEIMGKAFYIVKAGHIAGMKWLKLFVNANNCIPAILGKSIQESFSDIEICYVSLAIWKEGLEIIEHAGIVLDSLPGFEKEKITNICDMPLMEGARIFQDIMKSLSSEPLYGSILQSIKKGSKTEVDYLNGAFCDLADELGCDAPLNKKLVELVHEVEETNQFLSSKNFLQVIKEYVSG